MYVSPIVHIHSPPSSLFVPHPLHFSHSSSSRPPNTFFINSTKILNSLPNHLLPRSKPSSDSSDFDLNFSIEDINTSETETSFYATDLEFEAASEDDSNVVDIEIIKLGKNSRRITCGIAIDASLESVWSILTDYERLADYIPGLAVCQLLEKTENRARLFQIGEQDLAFGLKFNAKGIVDCYEKDIEKLPFGERRDIEFKMIEGDFEVFEGKWSIEETKNESESSGTSFQTTLSYVVDVKPKLWLPVGLVEGRLSREIKLNLLCIKKQAHKVVHETR